MAIQSKLDLRSLVGQTLILGFDGIEVSGKLRTMLQSLQPAGIILFARNIKEPRQTWELLRQCQENVALPMFFCVDMEGGTVDRLRNVIAPAPSVADIVASRNRPLFRRHGRVIGRECGALGFNVDFAPVLDLGFAASRSVLTSRTASADPKKAVVYAREFLRGLKDAHILGCGKHFPGLGEANLDTHSKLATIDKPWKKLWEEDLYPYRMLHRQMPFIMIAHALYSKVSKDRLPASISRKWISDILRKKIGYRGLIVSDDLEMGGIQSVLPMGKAAVATLKAGSDISLLCHKEQGVWEAYEAVLTAAEHDRRFAARVAEAAGHVLEFKKRSPALKHRRPAPAPATVDKLRRELWELSEEARIGKVMTEI
jgi:beta-N-acetylhexosaminidase